MKDFLLRTTAIVLAAVFAGTFFCAGTAHARKAKVELKVGTLAPSGVGWATLVRQILFPLVEQATNGQISLKVYWGGVMGDDDDVLRKMLIGQLQGAGMSAQGTLMACPEFNAVVLPFLFNNWDEVDYIRANTRKHFETYMERNGFILLFWIDQDFDQIYSTAWPFSEPEHFRRARFVTWYGEVERMMLTALGSRPVPINVPEIPSSVRAGVVDSFISPAIWAVGSQLYNTVKFVNPVKIRYSPATIFFTKQVWEGLDQTLGPAKAQQYRDNIWNARIESEHRFVLGTRDENRRCLEAMIKYGLTKVEMTKEQDDRLRSSAMEVWERGANRLYPRELLDEIVLHLEDFRALKDHEEIVNSTAQNLN